MIPISHINEWRAVAPWTESFQIEQDLILSRALVQIYSDSHLKDAFAFRGGTALQKIFHHLPTRYSEDIDLVQVRKEPIGGSIQFLRSALDPWLGKPRVDRGDARFTLKYRFQSESSTPIPMRLKIEINTGEHFTVLGHKRIEFQMQNSWFSGSCDVLTFEIEEILGTKLRALYQRKKGRDLYDMSMAFRRFKNLKVSEIVTCFQKYMEHEGRSVSRAEYESNLHMKLKDKTFIGDIKSLLSSDAPAFDTAAEGELLIDKVLNLLPGDPWKGPAKK